MISLNSEKEYIEKFKEKMIIRVGDYVNSKWEEQEDDFKRWERQKGKCIKGVSNLTVPSGLAQTDPIETDMSETRGLPFGLI